MTKVEVRFFDFIQKNILYFLIIAATLCGIFLRLFGMDFTSGDFLSFLNPWWEQIKNGGLEGLATQVGNYNIPYQIITYLLTLLPLEALQAYKLLSVLFDFILAIYSAMLVKALSKKNSNMKSVITYALVFCSATVIFNSSFWAQCDSIYVSFILMSVYYLVKDKNITSFVLLGVAFAFKLQTVFIIPLFIFYYFTTRKISILHFLIIPVVDFILCLPAVLLGRSVYDIIEIYLVQTDYGKQIQMNCPNFYALICDGFNTSNYYLFKTFSIVLTVLILGGMLALAIYKNVNILKKENFLLTAIWTVFTCIMFLSSMHERYSYLLDILLIIYAVTTAKKLWLPIVCTLISLRGYCYYLFQYEALDLKNSAIIYFAVYIYVTVLLLREVIFAKKNKDVVEKSSYIKKNILSYDLIPEIPINDISDNSVLKENITVHTEIAPDIKIKTDNTVSSEEIQEEIQEETENNI